MSEEHQQVDESNTLSSNQSHLNKVEEQEQQVKATAISLATPVDHTNTPVPNSNDTTTDYSSVDHEIWANITPQQNASLEALHQSMNLTSKSTAEGFQNLENQVQQRSPQPANNTATTTDNGNSIDAVAPPNNNTTVITTSTAAATEEKPAVGSEEWHKQRRENHKQVERRRRENINEGINEIARIVPGCEKNKGSILQRAAVYIRQLKESEAASVEKWTLEKLLTDQAINELNRQVEVFKTELERVKLENNYLKRELEIVTGGNNELLREVKKQKIEHQASLKNNSNEDDS